MRAALDAILIVMAVGGAACILLATIHDMRQVYRKKAAPRPKKGLFGKSDGPGNMSELYGAFAELSWRLVQKAMMVLGQGGWAASRLSRRSQGVRWYEWTLRLLLIGVVAYSSWIAATLQSAWPLLTIWAMACVLLAAAVWTDGSLGAKSKVLLSFAIPSGIFVVVATHAVAGISALLRLRAI